MKGFILKSTFTVFALSVALTLTLAVTACGMQGSHMGEAATSGTPGAPEINLGWSAVAGAQQGFYVEESTDSVNFSQVSTVADGTDNVSIPVGGPGLYYFRVRSFNQAGTSPYTPVVTAQVN